MFFNYVTQFRIFDFCVDQLHFEPLNSSSICDNHEKHLMSLPPPFDMKLFCMHVTQLLDGKIVL